VGVAVTLQLHRFIIHFCTCLFYIVDCASDGWAIFTTVAPGVDFGVMNTHDFEAPFKKL
jgi:hypothetical protein